MFGSNVKTPTLNVAIALFGLGQITLPNRNFARFILMLFIMFCLIIRTTWQGKMFELLQKDMRKPEVQSVEELIEMNYSFYIIQRFSEIFKGSDILERLVILNIRIK